jgi:hypothetical protein
MVHLPVFSDIGQGVHEDLEGSECNTACVFDECVFDECVFDECVFEECVYTPGL